MVLQCQFRKTGGASRGTASLEQTVLLLLVAVVFAAAALAVGPAILGYHNGIEQVLALPVP